MSCPRCKSDYGIHYSMRFCPYCGYEFRAESPKEDKCQHIAKADDPTNTCVKCGLVGKAYPNTTDSNHAPECPGESCDKMYGCPCVCHENTRKNYYTKAEVDERFWEMEREEQKFRRSLLAWIEGYVFDEKPVAREQIEHMRSRFLS